MLHIVPIVIIISLFVAIIAARLLGIF
jgi:hypothetical protein